jgi:hypothetical protein
MKVHRIFGVGKGVRNYIDETAVKSVISRVSVC